MPAPGNYVITGIPRSGTSLLSRLLDDQPDSVVINEPQEIFTLLATASSFREFPLFYQQLRRRILEKTPIANKLRDGRVVNDTALGQERSFYVPAVESADFLLGTKNTVAYLSRLEALHSLKIGPIFACIREPRATFVSWKKSFDHLRRADVRAFPIGGLPDTMLSASHRAELRKIQECKDLRMKRPLLWRYLASRLLDHREQIEIVCYEALTSNTAGVLRGILSRISNCTIHNAAPSDIKIQEHSYTEGLDKEELDMIADICGPAAEVFGYRL